jgi:hypothetical protein
MTITRLALVATNSDTLLTYALYVDPDPLDVSAAARLTLVVSNSTRHAITCTSIQVMFLQGPDAKDLTPANAAIQTQVPTCWSAARAGGDITLTPSGDAGTIGGLGLSFLIATTTNDQPGTATITIAEAASSPSQPSQTRTATIAVPKFPTRFSLSDLVATPDEIPFGGSVSLTWTGTQIAGATYKLQSPGSQPVTVGNTGPYAVPSLKIFPAVFTLTVSLTVPGQDDPLTVQKQTTVMQEPKLRILDFTASKRVVSVDDGKLALTWETLRATSLTLALAGVPGAVDVTGQSGCTVSATTFPPLVVTGASGQLGTLTPPDPYPRFLTFVLTAGDGTRFVQSSVQVEVPSPPTIAEFAFTNPTWTGIDLTWKTNATAATIAPLGSVDASGSRQVSNSFAVYTITAASGFGATTTAQMILLKISWEWRVDRTHGPDMLFYPLITIPRDLPGIGPVDQMRVTLPIGIDADDLILPDAKFYFGLPGGGWAWTTYVQGGVITNIPVKDGTLIQPVEITANTKPGVGRMTIDVTTSSTTHRGVYLVKKPGT